MGILPKKYTAKRLSSLNPAEALKVLQGLPAAERKRLMKELTEKHKRFAAKLTAEAMVLNLNENVKQGT